MDTSRSISQVIGCFCVTFMRWRSLLYIIHDDMTFSGEIKSGVPSFHLPPFSFERPVSNSSNSTNPDTEWVTFDTILSDLGMGLAMVPIIAILEQVAIAKAFCELLSSNSQFPFVCFVNENSFSIANGGKTDSTQEMIAVGMGSIFCSFFGCMPLTASFSRSSVMSASGGKTQFANFFNGISCLQCDVRF
jgi:sodium-independent sulfate anion transporter 11